jgi:hypothetical protein
MPAQVKVIRKAVTTAGTQEQLTATQTWVLWAIFRTENDTIYIGDLNVSATTGIHQKTTSSDLVMPPYATVPQQPFDLSTVWVDADTDGDAIQVIYLEAS